MVMINKPGLSDRPPELFSDPLRSFQGILAVGCQGGHIYLMGENFLAFCSNVEVLILPGKTKPCIIDF